MKRRNQPQNFPSEQFLHTLTREVSLRENCQSTLEEESMEKSLEENLNDLGRNISLHHMYSSIIVNHTHSE